MGEPNIRQFVIKAGMTPQDVINSDKATAQQKKMAYVLTLMDSQREADVFNATSITDRGTQGVSLWTRYQDGTKKETKYTGDIASFKFAPNGDVKPYVLNKSNTIQNVSNNTNNKVENKTDSNKSLIYDGDGVELKFPTKSAMDEYIKISGDVVKERDKVLADAWKEREAARAEAWKERENTKGKAWVDYKEGKISREKMIELQNQADTKMRTLQDNAENKMRKLQEDARNKCWTIQNNARERLGAVEIELLNYNK